MWVKISSIPQKLQINPIENFLKVLEESSFLTEKVYWLDIMHPNIKQTIISYFSKKLKNQYNKDINPSKVRVLLFNTGEENTHPPFLNIDLIKFVLNYSWFFYALNSVILKANLSLDAQDIRLEEILRESDILEIKSQHQAKLDLFWQKHCTNYQVLAKFSYLRALLEQQNSDKKLSERGFEMALQAMGFSLENIETVKEFDLKNIPSNSLTTSLRPTQVEVSSFILNNQMAADIVQVYDPKTKDLFVLYIPGYQPAFIEANEEWYLAHWIFGQTQFSDNFSIIASHFSLSSRMMNNHKLDAFLYTDYRQHKENVKKVIVQEDVFSFIMERQKARGVADLYATGIPKDILLSSFLNYQSTESALFTTIQAAIAYIPDLLPNIHTISSDLREFFPNPYTTASEYMKKNIRDKLGLDIDPDKTFIRLSLHGLQPTYDPMVPPIFGGGVVVTIQSLTEAALSNYRETLSLYSYANTVIYQNLSVKMQDPSKDQLLNILPKDIERIVQEADLDTLHKNILNSFWNTHADQVSHFIKHRYLQHVLKEYQNRTLSEEDLKIILQVTLYSLDWEEEPLNAINTNSSIEILSVAGYQTTDMFVLRNANQQRVILYIAGNAQAFFTFDTYEKCIYFLEENAKKDIHWQELLLSHFSMDVQDSVRNSLKKGSFFMGAFPPPSKVYLRHSITTEPIQESLFVVIKKNIQERSYMDANVLITSNTEAVLERIRNVAKLIEIVLLVPSFAFPIINWISLTALITETSVDLYIAKNGDTVKERHQAAIDVGINTIGAITCAFLNFRSLKLSKQQSSFKTTYQSLRIATGGRGAQVFLKKTPISEEMFFHTRKPMQVWNIIASDDRFNHLDVKGWFLDDQFLLFTGKANKADHLIISSHGGVFPTSGIVQVPENTELIVLGPHGWILFDPKTINIAKGTVLPYGIINENTAVPSLAAMNPSYFSKAPNPYPKRIDAKILVGTNIPGYIRNYTLSKYQKFGVGEESYLDIVQIINRSRNARPIISELGQRPVDILTIRNRIGRLDPTLEDVFTSLKNYEIQYKKITLAFCRSKVFEKSPPIYIAPIV